MGGGAEVSIIHLETYKPRVKRNLDVEAKIEEIEKAGSRWESNPTRGESSKHWVKSALSVVVINVVSAWFHS